MNPLTKPDNRSWLQRQDERISNALSYYLGPAAAPLKDLANLGAAISPGADMMDMAEQSNALTQAKTWGDAGKAGLGLGAAALGMFIPGTAKGISEGVEGVADGIRAYHGSPHDFDRFDISKIGTGEGAQAYGRGIYLAENEKVAKAYRDGLSGEKFTTPDGKEFGTYDDFKYDWLNPRAAAEPGGANFPSLIERGLSTGGGGRDATASYGDELRRSAGNLRTLAQGKYRDQAPEFEAAASFAERLADEGIASKSGGHMYETRINANPEDFLDWDVPLSQQSEKVRNALPDVYRVKGWQGDMVPLRDVMNQFSASGLDPLKASAPYLSSAPVAYSDLAAQYGGHPEAVKALSAAGIPGIRYMDQGSRGTSGGTSNYVVFDDKTIEILRKYGLAAGAVGAGGIGVNALSQYQPEGGGT